MDTPVRVVVYGSEADADAALAEIARLEDLWHPSRAASDVARVNAAAGLAPVMVAPETLDLVERALVVASLTDGAFDPTVGPVVAAWNIGGTEHRAPTPAERALVDWKALRVDRAKGTVFLERPGMVMELGAIAKGYAADAVREFLVRRGVKNGLVQLGGSVALLGRRPEGGKWQVAVQHPRRADDFLAVLPLEGGFVDTAGDYQRFYLGPDGVRYHHILDPATGAPARGMASVTVVAARGSDADAYATSAFVLGLSDGYDFLVRHGVEGILVSDQGEVRVTPGLAGKVEVKVKPWP